MFNFSKRFVVMYTVFILENPMRHQTRAFYTENYSDLIIGNSNLLERHNECCLTESKCGKLCLYHPRCVSFYYNDQQQLCQLHYTVIPSSANLLPSTGSKYFVMSEGAIQCPSVEWYYFGGSCYLFGKNTTTWIGAKNTCVSMNAHLAIVTSKEENKFLVSLAKQQKTYGGNAGSWLDGTDALAEGDWIWSTTGDKLTFTAWKDKNPNNFNGNQHCLQIEHFEEYEWNDAYCSRETEYICEKNTTA